MTALLTKEESETVEQARTGLNTIDLCETAESVYDRAADLSAHVDNLLTIIDNLSKRGVKKYSEEELRNFAKESGVSYKSFPAYFEGVTDFARFLGALEEK